MRCAELFLKNYSALFLLVILLFFSCKSTSLKSEPTTTGIVDENTAVVLAEGVSTRDNQDSESKKLILAENAAKIDAQRQLLDLCMPYKNNISMNGLESIFEKNKEFLANAKYEKISTFCHFNKEIFETYCKINYRITILNLKTFCENHSE